MERGGMSERQAVDRVIATAAPADLGLYYTVVGALAATLMAVALYFYLPLVSRLGRWYLARLRRQLRRLSQLAHDPTSSSAIEVGEAFSAVAAHLAFALALAPLLLAVVPLFATMWSLQLAAALITAP